MNAEAWRFTVSALAEVVKPWQPDLLIGIESRGFLTAAPLANHMGLGFAMVRKEGKLPGDTLSYSYDLEYGSDTMEIQSDVVKPGQRVVVLDDLLATGGTMKAAIALLRQAGAEVAGAAFIIELNFLGGRDELDVPCQSLITFDT